MRESALFNQTKLLSVYFRCFGIFFFKSCFEIVLIGPGVFLQMAKVDDESVGRSRSQLLGSGLKPPNLQEFSGSDIVNKIAQQRRHFDEQFSSGKELPCGEEHNQISMSQ